MKKITLLLVLGMAITFANAQTKKDTASTPGINKTVMKVTDLQKNITKDISKTYEGFKAVKAFKIDSSGVITYNVSIEKAQNHEKWELYYNNEGNFIRKEAIVKPAAPLKPGPVAKPAPAVKPAVVKPVAKPAPAAKPTTPAPSDKK